MSRNMKAVLSVIAGNAIFGFSFLFSKLALQITLPSVLIAVRFISAFLLLNIIVLAGRMIRKKDGSPLISFSLKGKPWKDILLLALFQPIIYFIAENYGIVFTSSAFAGIIIALIPLAGIVADYLVMHERATKRHVICAFCSVVGVALTTLGAVNMNSSLLGLLLLLVAVVAGAMFYVFSKRSGTHYSPLERTYVMFGCGSVFYLILAFVQCQGENQHFFTDAVNSPVFWTAILYLAAASSVLAFLLLNFGSSYVSVTQATLFANITTVISIFAGVVVLHEDFSWTQALGVVLILGSVYLAQVTEKKHKQT